MKNSIELFRAKIDYPYIGTYTSVFDKQLLKEFLEEKFSVNFTEEVDKLKEDIKELELLIKSKQMLFDFATNPDDKKILKVKTEKVLKTFIEKLLVWYADNSYTKVSQFEIINVEVIKRKRLDSDIVKCAHCELPIHKADAIKSNLYDKPFDKAPNEAYFCSPFCYESMIGEIYSKDFRYFECAECNRNICEQNPSNGWMTQYRYLGDEKICLKCYEEHLFNEGISDEDIENENLSGMFLDYRDLNKHGFDTDESYYVRGKNDVKEVFKRIRYLKKEGKIVVIEYNSLAIGGSEGHITLWAKKIKNQENKLCK
jgi:hypothetical protein